MAVKLSKHFTLKEAITSQTATRLGIDNTPNEIQIQKIGFVSNFILEPPREYFKKSFSPSSWFRCIDLCTAIGSSAKSQHAKAEAVDFEIPGVDNLDLAIWMTENVKFDQLILEYYEPGVPDSGWVHCSYASSYHNRGEILTYSGGIYTPGLPV